MTDFVTGHKELDHKLREIGGPIARRVVVKSIRAGLAEVRDAIKSEVTKPSVKRAIASRFKRRKKGTYQAVAGGGVGKRNKGKRPTRGGVGIAKENVHWYLMGTSARSTAKGAGRGSMPAHPAVRRGFAKSSNTAMAKVREKIRTELIKEVRKLRASR